MPLAQCADSSTLKIDSPYCTRCTNDHGRVKLLSKNNLDTRPGRRHAYKTIAYPVPVGTSSRTTWLSQECQYLPKFVDQNHPGQQGCGSTFIVCGSGSSCFFSMRIPIHLLLNANPDPAKQYKKMYVPFEEFPGIEKDKKYCSKVKKKIFQLVQIYRYLYFFFINYNYYRVPVPIPISVHFSAFFV